MPKAEIAPPKGFKVLEAPVNVPVKIPDIDLSKAVTNENDFSGKGVKGGSSTGTEGSEGTKEGGAAGSAVWAGADSVAVASVGVVAAAGGGGAPTGAGRTGSSVPAPVASRRPTQPEGRVLLELLQRRLEHYKQHPDLAAKLIAAGASKPGNVEAVELAAWTTVASTIFNLDETVTKE